MTFTDEKSTSKIASDPPPVGFVPVYPHALTVFWSVRYEALPTMIVNGRPLFAPGKTPVKPLVIMNELDWSPTSSLILPGSVAESILVCVTPASKSASLSSAATKASWLLIDALEGTVPAFQSAEEVTSQNLLLVLGC